ncbi:PREDICTED: V(D)J recombination-activating protein 1-like, partial [Priapulus caudatus]|uniref:V(D)J recombination-activating protein 1-like n=1 Tax=Priapulus caudatus TaxID=37621 RepID=A0ABM1F770_PRICU
MSEIDNHIQNLAKICRLCHVKKATREKRVWKKVEEYADILQTSFAIDVSLDDEATHPKSVCEKCRLKLRYIKRAGGSSVATTFDIKTYSPHDSLNCDICKKQEQEGRGQKRPRTKHEQ